MKMTGFAIIAVTTSLFCFTWFTTWMLVITLMKINHICISKFYMTYFIFITALASIAITGFIIEGWIPSSMRAR